MGVTSDDALTLSKRLIGMTNIARLVGRVKIELKLTLSYAISPAGQIILMYRKIVFS